MWAECFYLSPTNVSPKHTMYDELIVYAKHESKNNIMTIKIANIIKVQIGLVLLIFRDMNWPKYRIHCWNK